MNSHVKLVYGQQNPKKAIEMSEYHRSKYTINMYQDALKNLSGATFVLYIAFGQWSDLFENNNDNKKQGLLDYIKGLDPYVIKKTLQKLNDRILKVKDIKKTAYNKELHAHVHSVLLFYTLQESLPNVPTVKAVKI